MKANLLLIICFLSKGAFSQLAIVQTVTGPQMGYVSMPVGASSRVDNYYHYDLNKNSYYGGNRDITEIDRVIPSSEKYSYENFLTGNLIYSSGNQSQVAKMNYHLLYGEMQFIDEKGDTLFIANTDSIAFVRFEKTLYLHNSQNGYLKIINGNSNVKLCSQQKLKLNEGYYASNTNINLPVERLVISTKEYYYLVDKEVRYEANKSGFLKAFPKHKQQINTYLQQLTRQRMAIKFYKEDDLIRLMNFCTSLLEERI